MRQTLHSARNVHIFFLLLASILALTLFPFATPAHASNTNSVHAVTHREAEEGANMGRVVLIMTSALQWKDLNTYNAPRLRELAASGSIGNMIPLSGRGTNCPLDSWLTMSKGIKTTRHSLAPTKQCEVPPPTPGANIAFYNSARPISSLDVTLLHRANLENYGTLSLPLTEGGITSYGIGTGASYVLATTSNTYPYGWEDTPDSNVQLGERVAQLAQTHNLTVVDADIAKLMTSDDYPDSLSDENDREKQKKYRDDFYAHQAQMNAERVEAILEYIPDQTRVIIASLVNRSGQNSQMTVIADVGGMPESFEPIFPGMLYSSSVHRTGTLQLTDIAPTILSWFSLPRPDSMTGASLVNKTVAGDEPCTSDQPCFIQRYDTLVDDSAVFRLVRDIRGPFLKIFYYIAALFFLGSIVVTAKTVWNKSLGKRTWVRKLWIWLGYTLSALPLCAIVTNLHDWWRSDPPLATYVSLAWGCAGVLGLAAMMTRRLHRLAPLFTILVPTALFILVDTLTGSRAMADSAIGHNTLLGGRFYGIGNEAYSLLAAASLFSLTFGGVWLRDRLVRTGKSKRLARSVAVCTVGLAGLIVAAIDALPRYGADFGGALSYIPALLVLLTLLSETTLSWRKGVFIAGVTVISAVLIAFADWLRPPSARTHLGNFFQSILDGRLFTVIAHKLAINFHILTGSTYTLTVLRGILLLVVVLIPALTYRASRNIPLTPRGEQSTPEPPRTEEKTASALMHAWTRAATRTRNISRTISVFYQRAWSWLSPHTADEAATVHWPALRSAFIVELVAFVLAFALNDSGVVLPAVAMLLLLPMLTSFVIDSVPDTNSHEFGA